MFFQTQIQVSKHRICLCEKRMNDSTLEDYLNQLKKNIQKDQQVNHTTFRQKRWQYFNAYRNEQSEILYKNFTQICLMKFNQISSGKQQEYISLPSTSPLKINEIRQLQLSLNKVNTLLNNNINQYNPLLFEAQLVPFKKAHPKIPNANEFRPLVVLSALYKFIGLKFLPKLNKYLIGKKSLIIFLQERISQVQMRLIFYKIFKITNIFQEMLNKIQLTKRVSQGQPISSALFNIYMDEFIEILKIKQKLTNIESIKLPYYPKLIYDRELSTVVIDSIEIIKQQFQMIVNQVKSGLFLLNQDSDSKYLRVFPILKEYKYLGHYQQQKEIQIIIFGNFNRLAGISDLEYLETQSFPAVGDNQTSSQLVHS